MASVLVLSVTCLSTTLLLNMYCINNNIHQLALCTSQLHVQRAFAASGR